MSSGVLPVSQAFHTDDKNKEQKYEGSSSQQPVLSGFIFQLAKVVCSVAIQFPLSQV